jgi:hypothetical protein
MIGTTFQIGALFDLAHEALTPSACVVVVGPPTDDLGPDFCAVGYADDRRAATGTTVLADFGAGVRTTNGSIWTLLVASTEDKTSDGVMEVCARVEAWATTLATALQEDPQLGGAVGQPGMAYPGRFELDVDQTESGCAATVLLETVIDTHTEGWSTG